jgi:hypothetical protein
LILASGLEGNTDYQPVYLEEGQKRSMQERKTVPHVILFTGHMIDTAARKIPRFPTESEGLARKMIQQAVMNTARKARENWKRAHWHIRWGLRR